MNEYTPVELRNGRYYKREDLLRHSTGVNGSKWRQCQFLVSQAAAQGANIMITGASVLSPQHAMTSVAAKAHGMDSLHVIGATTPEKACKHPSVRVAVENGALIRAIPVAFNPALQREVYKLHKEMPGSAILHYGVAVPPGTNPKPFHELGARQVASIPNGLTTMIMPFGSGNSGASVLYGLSRHPEPPKTIHLIGIGPNKLEWLRNRLKEIGADVSHLNIKHHDLHGTKQVSYQEKVPYVSDDIKLHPTYEGKVARWADGYKPAGWVERDGSCLFWIVGGPV